MYSVDAGRHRSSLVIIPNLLNLYLTSSSWCGTAPACQSPTCVRGESTWVNTRTPSPRWWSWRLPSSIRVPMLARQSTLPPILSRCMSYRVSCRNYLSYRVSYWNYLFAACHTEWIVEIIYHTEWVIGIIHSVPVAKQVYRYWPPNRKVGLSLFTRIDSLFRAGACMFFVILAYLYGWFYEWDTTLILAAGK